MNWVVIVGGQLKLSSSGAALREDTGEALPGVLGIGLGCGQIASAPRLDGEKGHSITMFQLV